MSRPQQSSAVAPGVNPWIVALTVTMATFMEVLDTTIANVALPHIAGGLGAGKSQSTWVLTSYLVANAIVLPLSGWFSNLIGRKRFYMACVFLFTVSSALCGMSRTLEELIFFRILQGAGGGGLQPSEQGILVDTFPPEKRGMAMAVYGVAVVVAPVLGPTLGGWITDNYTWHWLFFINIPVGCLSLLLTSVIVQDPPHMAEERARSRRSGFKIDYVGICLVTLTFGSLEVVYAKGQEYDWFWSEFVMTFMAIAVVGLVVLVIWELRHPQPILNLRLLKERNFAVTAVIIFIAFGALYGSNANLPQMLQELFGYDATRAGLVMSPTALFPMAAMPVVGFLLGRKTDARWLIGFGLICVTAGSYWQALLNLEASPYTIIVPRSLQLFGMGFLFVPLNTAAYVYISANQTSNASGLFNLVRNEGASFGIAVATTMLDRRSQFHQLRLVEHIHSANPHVATTLGALTGQLDTAIGTAPAAADRQGFAMLYQMVREQARLMSYLDVFWLAAVGAAIVFPLVFVMRRAVSESGLATH
ncbi:MAG TPA: DHA2 family efflux MFS transporter permease subunit [Pirellulales bacterium]|nr:DHA2 family efflux MFS transporter permease subunit [Pirellulales bacterium]